MGECAPLLFLAPPAIPTTDPSPDTVRAVSFFPWCPVSFQKDYPNRKDRRAEYRTGGAIHSRGCRPNGSCGYCRSNRLHADRVRELAAGDAEQAVEQPADLDDDLDDDSDDDRDPYCPRASAPA